MMLLMNNKTCTIHSEMMKNDTLVLQLAWVSMISLTRNLKWNVDMDIDVIQVTVLIQQFGTKNTC